MQGDASTAPTPSRLVTVCAPPEPAVQSPRSGGFALRGEPVPEDELILCRLAAVDERLKEVGDRLEAFVETLWPDAPKKPDLTLVEENRAIGRDHA